MPSRSNRNEHASRIPTDRDLAELLLNFEADDVCTADNESLSKALQKHSKCGCRVANRLLTCIREDGELCGSGACRRCGRQSRRELYASVSRIGDLFRSDDGSHGLVVSVIPADLQAAPGELHKLNLYAITSRMWRAVHSMDLCYPVFGGIDVSYNEDAHRVIASHWQVHFAFALLGAPADPATQVTLRKKVLTAFTFEPSAKRPLYVQTLEDLPRQLSYLFKSSFARRVSITAANGRPNTLHRHLKTRERVELALWLHSYPLPARLVLNGIRRHGLTLHLNPDLHVQRQK